jgi:cell division protein FtsB
MARNRKYQSAAVRFGPALKAMMLCLLIGGSGIGYVWQKDQLRQLGQQIKRREQRLDWLSDQNKKLREQLAKMRTPEYLEWRIKDLKLGLAQPQPAQVCRLPEPSRELKPSSSSERQFAAQSGQ